ncbi:MAG: hypothetical protein M1286_02395 [Candidatus Marsarchaeota archaeon]|nr:hypothetical protein [Candidatus Marsarchaeota archaeon]
MAVVRKEDSYLVHAVPTELLKVVRSSHYPKLSVKEVNDYIVNYSD